MVSAAFQQTRWRVDNVTLQMIWAMQYGLSTYSKSPSADGLGRLLQRVNVHDCRCSAQSYLCYHIPSKGFEHVASSQSRTPKAKTSEAALRRVRSSATSSGALCVRVPMYGLVSRQWAVMRLQPKSATLAMYLESIPEPGLKFRIGPPTWPPAWWTTGKAASTQVH